jgi:hypothetical protein
VAMSIPSGSQAEAYSQRCSCGRVFSLPAAFKNHQNSCLTSKHELSASLARSKDILAARKAAKASLTRRAIQNNSTGFLDVLVGSREPEGSYSMQVGRMAPQPFLEWKALIMAFNSRLSQTWRLQESISQLLHPAL